MHTAAAAAASSPQNERELTAFIHTYFYTLSTFCLQCMTFSDLIEATSYIRVDTCLRWCDVHQNSVDNLPSVQGFCFAHWTSIRCVPCVCLFLLISFNWITNRPLAISIGCTQMYARLKCWTSGISLRTTRLGAFKIFLPFFKLVINFRTTVGRWNVRITIDQSVIMT